MDHQEAAALVLFVKDHDTRYLPSIRGDDPEFQVQLTGMDGEVLEAVQTVADYENRFITAHDPGPTIRAAWEKWRPRA